MRTVAGWNVETLWKSVFSSVARRADLAFRLCESGGRRRLGRGESMSTGGNRFTLREGSWHTLDRSEL